MSKHESQTGDNGNLFEKVFCDTLLFMLMLQGFCEAGHVAPLPGPAYSTRFRQQSTVEIWGYNALNLIDFRNL